MPAILLHHAAPDAAGAVRVDRRVLQRLAADRRAVVRGVTRGRQAEALARLRSRITSWCAAWPVSFAAEAGNTAGR